MELDLLYLITVVPAILLFGISKAGLGGSVALISIPLMTIVMPFGEALAITLPILILADFVAVYKFRKEFDFQILKLILSGAFIGIIIGALTFKYFSEDVLKLLVGLMGFSFTFHYFFLKKDKYQAIPNSKAKGGFFFLMPLVVIGVLIGYYLVKVIEEKLFYNIIYILIFLSSFKLIFDFINL